MVSFSAPYKYFIHYIQALTVRRPVLSEDNMMMSTTQA